MQPHSAHTGDLSAGALRRALFGAAALVGALALAALALARSDAGEDAVLELLQRTRPELLVLALVVMTGGMFFMALRWRALMPGGERLPPLPLTAIECSGLLLNYALPGPVGELAVAVLVNRRYGVDTASALAAGIHSRFVGLGTAGLLAGAMWLSGLPVPDEYRPAVGATAAAIAVATGALGLLSARPRILRSLSAATLGGLGRRLPGRLGRGVGRVDDAVEHVADALGQVGRLGPRRYAEAVLWAFCGHGSVAAGIGIGALAMGMSPAPAGVMFTYTAATAGVVALFAVPGAQVGWDAMFCSFFMLTAGVTLTDAAAVTVLVRVQQLLLMFTGALALGVMSPYRKDQPGPGSTSSTSESPT